MPAAHRYGMATYISDRGTNERRDKRCDPCTEFDEHGHPQPVYGGEPRAWTPFDLEAPCARCGGSINRAVIDFDAETAGVRRYQVPGSLLRAGDIADLDALIPSTIADVQPVEDDGIWIATNEGCSFTFAGGDQVIVYPRQWGATR
jgi:hypothetical protein